MRSGLRVLKVRGVELKVHFSLIFLLVYVVFVSAIQFPAVVDQSGLQVTELSVGPWLAGVVFAIGLLVSIAMHEFGHVWVAQAQGVPVRGVTLMMLGGMSEMGKMPERPYSEMKLAIVGPMVSLGIWGVLSLVREITSISELDFFSYWLGSANLVLALFNLLPAFPLDGGRVLRSILAARQGSVRGTQNAVRVSRGFAWFFGIVGFVYFNILLILIAFFIHSAAQAEWNLLMTRDLFKNVSVREAMREVDSLFESSTLTEAISRMIENRVQVLPVQVGPGNAALIDLSSIRPLDRGTIETSLVKEYMQPAPKILSSSDSISDILADVLGAPLLALPVQEGGRIVGVLHHRDLADLVQFKAVAGTLTSHDKNAA